MCSQLLKKNMQLLMNSVDCLQQDTYRLLGYEKTLAKQVQAKQQFLQRRVSNVRSVTIIVNHTRRLVQYICSRSIAQVEYCHVLLCVTYDYGSCTLRPLSPFW